MVGKKKCWTLAYADGLGIVAIIKRLKSFLQSKNMTFNTKKTKAISFTKPRARKPDEDNYWREIELEKVKLFKYLGYTF